MSTVDMFEPVVTFDSLVRALARALGSETRAGCLETPEGEPAGGRFRIGALAAGD